MTRAMPTAHAVASTNSLREGFRAGWRSRPRIALLAEVVGMLRLLSRVARAMVESMRRQRVPVEELIVQTWYTIKVCTLPALAVSVPFGVVMALQVGILSQQVGAVSFTGAGNTLAVIRQAAPLITALMLSGVAGSAICADIGARKIREELDAMEVMGIPVIERLVMPRTVATVVVSCLLNGIVMFFSIITTLLVSVVLLNISPGTYLASIYTLAWMGDLYLAFVKAAVFGLICAIVAAHYGMSAKAGPTGVGDAVTTAVVVNFVGLFAANFVISQIATAFFLTGPLG